jgi:hypothetical protein
MARDYEDLNDIGDLSDDELRILVRDRLDAHNALDIDDLTVHVRDGTVILGGRVGTEGERLIAEHVVTDLVAAAGVRNEILVDPIRRAESPEAIDEHLVDEDRRAGLQLGDRPTSQSPEVEEREPPIDADLYGTTDVRTSISDGTPWVPPESPTPEGNSEGTS